MLDALEALREVHRRAAQRKLYAYKPYPFQADFHAAGPGNSERMLMAANRVGKTQCAAAEVAYHLTGVYPPWWEGIRFTKPVLVWTGSPTNETSRDIVQKELLGGSDPETLGTGWIPRDKLVGRPKMRQAGVSDVIDAAKVRHASGGVSTLVLKTYEQGWRKWQGSAPHVVWLDEEPEDMKIYSEAQTRVMTTRGTIMVTFTPLLGETELVQHFMSPKASGIWMRTATWEDAPHLREEDKIRLRAAFPDYEVEARSRGVPMLGSGRVFSVSEDEIKVPPFPIPAHWARIKGIDFGIGSDHPQATAAIAHDRDRDTIYVYATYRAKGKDTIHHVAQLNSFDRWAPIAWPHDGMNRDKSGTVLHALYRANGAESMLPLSARYKRDTAGPQPVEPIVMEVLERMVTGRFKVFATCADFFDEFRSYHRKDGILVADREDVLKATFYAVMMRRHAMPEPSQVRPAQTGYARALVSTRV